MKNILFILLIFIVSTVFAEQEDYPYILNNWMSANTSYQDEEVGDYWKSSAETIRDKGGDCEDLAILVSDKLTKNGFKNYLVCIRIPFSYSHVICVFKETNNTWSYFDNGVYRKVNAKSIKILMRKNYLLYEYQIIKRRKNELD